MNEDGIITTKLFKSNKEFTLKRAARIAEAIAFEGGTIENPNRHLISSLPNGKESYFFKPGIETKRKTPNIYDMAPNVGATNGISETANWKFEKIWEYLIKISIINQITFKKVLTILYRNCFLIDHTEIKPGKFRYTPSEELLVYIDKIEFALKDGFMDKFNTKEIGLMEYLHFIDLLGWNEDVKYHIVNGQPDFEEREKNVGRVNTILSVVSAPLLISNFILDIVKKTQTKGIIDVNLITSTIQIFSKTRGMCVLSGKELLKQLTPFIIE